jgi:hypothetical protein
VGESCSAAVKSRTQTTADQICLIAFEGLSNATGARVDDRKIPLDSLFKTMALMPYYSKTHWIFSSVLPSCGCPQKNTRLEAREEKCVYHWVGRISRTQDQSLNQSRISLFYLVGLFDLWDGIRTLLISSAGAYIIAWKIDGGFMPWIAFVFLMGHMSISHIYRQYVNPPDLFDITGEEGVSFELSQ